MYDNFILLKRTYPISKYDRYCDGYAYIMKNTTPEKRKEWGIEDKQLQQIIKKGEKYMYEVGKENNTFKTLSISFSNYAIIRKFIYDFDDE
jgi:hypothetical protein